MSDIAKTPPTGPQVAKLAGISQEALADKLGITRSAIAQWDEVPLKRVVHLSAVTSISPADLRPDVFGALEAAQ